MNETQRSPIPAVGVVCFRGDDVLLIKRGAPPRAGEWSLPGGRIEFGERAADAALRELREETGWQAQRADEIIRYNPSYGSSDQLFMTWLASDLTWVGMDEDQDEVMETGWFTLEEIGQLIARGEMPDGLSLVPLLHLMAQRRTGLA